MLPRETLVALAKRALVHHQNGTTDQADQVMEMPVAEYGDPDMFQHEMQAMFRRVPLALAFSCELPHPGDYKAMDVAGIPVLMVRDRDGAAGAFLNVCRHRGTIVCEAGTGHKTRFSCPYHSWVYDDRGALIGMFGKETLGPIDQTERSLRRLSCEERAGIIWVSLTPDTPLHLDAWLGALGPELAGYDFQNWSVFDRMELTDAPGWKVAYDGFIEIYHLSSLHPKTVGPTTISNLMIVDQYGPHQRSVTCRPTLGELAKIPIGEWKPEAYLEPSYILFPNAQFVGAVRGFVVFSQIMPGRTVGTSRTITTFLTRDPVPESERAALAQRCALYRTSIGVEDFGVGKGIQGALDSGANTTLIFGRNELTLQHQHNWIEKLSKNPWPQTELLTAAE
jgi:phenylpropionate dioxygenase-like ring-hydroxylating dioxygenase large terminal subunit